MLYHFIYQNFNQFPLGNVFRYITFRSILCFVLAFASALWLGKKFIDYMRKKQFGQSIREVGPKAHLKKQGTPTMGGVFIFIAAFTSILICGNFSSFPLLSVLLITGSFFALGFFDDYLKVLRSNSDGVSGRFKLFWQFTTALCVVGFLYFNQFIDGQLYLPFLKEPLFDMGWGYVIFASFVIVGSSNAVNLTDGLDGLAIVPVLVSIVCLGILSYLSGHTELSGYLYIPYFEGAGEITVFAAGLSGASMAFLWYNCHPAEVFMGDTGSLSLGGALGAISVVTKNEFLFALLGGVFVLEAVSVMLQVASFKLRGKRIFKMAPIHHHFELSGWSENKVIVRFWIVSLILGALALSTLKLR